MEKIKKALKSGLSTPLTPVKVNKAAKMTGENEQLEGDDTSSIFAIVKELKSNQAGIRQSLDSKIDNLSKDINKKFGELKKDNTRISYTG